MSLDVAAQQRIAAAAMLLRAGQLVCFPTETMYGIAADIRRLDALERLTTLKGRAESSPFGLIASELDHVRALTRVWPEPAARLAEKHWPGPLTVVVPARAELPSCLVGTDGGVGVRLSSHPWAAALAREVGGPITATSANLRGQPAAMNVAMARQYFGDAIADYLDAGPAAQQTPSTVVAISESGSVRVLRAGAVDITTTRT